MAKVMHMVAIKTKREEKRVSPLRSCSPQGPTSEQHNKIQQKGFSTGALTDIYILNH